MSTTERIDDLAGQVRVMEPVSDLELTEWNVTEFLGIVAVIDLADSQLALFLTRLHQELGPRYAVQYRPADIADDDQADVMLVRRPDAPARCPNIHAADNHNQLWCGGRPGPCQSMSIPAV